MLIGRRGKLLGQTAVQIDAGGVLDQDAENAFEAGDGNRTGQGFRGHQVGEHRFEQLDRVGG